jgi:hypothetical protein
LRREKTRGDDLCSDERDRVRLCACGLRNSHRARRRGWITTATSAAELSASVNNAPRQIVFRWRTPEDDLHDAEAAERERLGGAGKHVVSIGLGDGGKNIDHEADPEPSNKD